MLGLETPPEIQGRVFGLSASATALGFGLGPLLAGTIAGVLSVPAGLFTMGAVALVLAVLVAVAGRRAVAEIAAGRGATLHLRRADQIDRLQHAGPDLAEARML